MVTENAHRHHTNFGGGQTHDQYIRKLAHQLATVEELKLRDGTVLKKAARTVQTRAPSPANTPAASMASGVAGSFGGWHVGADGEPHTIGPSLGQLLECKWCWMVHGNKKRIKTRCKECDTGFCDPARTGERGHGGRNCFELHKQHGLPPMTAWKAKGSETVKRKWHAIADGDVHHLHAAKCGNKGARAPNGDFLATA